MRRPQLVLAASAAFAMLAALAAAGSAAAAAGAAADAVAAPVPQQAPGRRVAADALATARGGTASALPQAVLTGRLSDVQASSVVSGSNSLAGGALAGMSGIPVVIQNTGSNVLIQNATVVNVTVK